MGIRTPTTMSASVPWDTINGVSIPYLLRGTYDGAAWFVANGGVLGSQAAHPSQRVENGAVLNSLFSLAASQQKFIELEPNTYEINNSTGLVVPPGSDFVLRGGRGGTIIKQFYNSGAGAPVLQIGDPTGTVLSTAQDIEGLWLQYGSSQTGLTNAAALSVNNIAFSRIGCMGIGGVGLNPAYNNINFNGGPVFSCSIFDINCNQALQNQLLVSVDGTGNVFNNIYLNNGGTGTFNPLDGNYVAFEGGVTNEMTFIQLNCEWGSINRLMDLQNMVGLHFIDLHIEGIKFTGSSPVVFNTANSAITWDTCDFVDCLVQTGNMSGSLCIMLDYNGSSSALQMNNLTWINNFSGQINAPILVFSPSGGTLGNDTSVVSINKGSFRDASNTNIFLENVQFDVHMPVTSSRFYAPLRFDRYDWGPWGSVLNKNVIYPISSTYTHYGQHQNSTLLVPPSITSFTITLSNLMGATGTQNVPTGTVTHIRRESGSASGTLTVKDDAGSTLTTNTTSGQDFFYQFNGTHYVIFTQVT
jgi:hypothetical protein